MSTDGIFGVEFFVIPWIQEGYSSVSSCLVAEEMEERGKEYDSFLLDFFF